MSVTEYTRKRSHLLSAAAWHAYVSCRGTNAETGRTRRRENQAQLAALRVAYQMALAHPASQKD